MATKGTLEKFVEVANGEIGKTDRTRYGAPASADWCAYFVCWCAEEAGIGTSSDSAALPKAPNNKSSVPQVYQWYVDNRRLLAPSTSSTSNNRPQVGDIAIIDVYATDRPGDTNHIGIVVEVSGSGSSMTVKCVEGNISGGKVSTVTYTNLKISSQGISYLASNHVSY